jgi:UDP-GlcNAc:undecaprenyl-phosphate GlcNAc-1-phosphate transferase
MSNFSFGYYTYLGFLVVAALGAFWFTPLASWLAGRVGAMDEPNERKVHSKPMPRLGGVAVFLGFLLPWVVLPFYENAPAKQFQEFQNQFLFLLAGTLAMLALGIYDDIKGADASKKFFAQIVIATFLWLAGFRIEAITNPFASSIIHLPVFIGLPLTVLWIVGVTNAVNLLDGIDGLVAGVTACMALSLAVINILSQQTVVALLNLALAGACLGFLPHNHAPARIFLGDSGSLTIGLVLSCIAIVSLFKQQANAVSALITVPLLLFALPLFDTARVMYHRWSRGVSIFQADKNHIHHRLLAMGMSHRQAAWILYSVAGATGLMSIVLSQYPIPQLHLSALFAALAVAFAVVWRLRLRHSFIENEESATARAALESAHPVSKLASPVASVAPVSKPRRETV